MDLRCGSWMLGLGYEGQAVDGEDPFAPRREQRGATLVESMAFLGTATIIAVNSVSLLQNATTDVASLTISQEATMLQLDVRALYGVKSITPGSLDMSVLKAAQRLPPSLRLSADGSAAQNQWGGDVTLLSVPDHANEFVLSYSNVPSPVCVQALVDTGSNWVAVGVEGGSAGFVAPGEMTPELAARQCAGGAQTVEWVSD